MPAMAGDWPRAPRAYRSPQHSDPPAPVRTLPSVAELLSSRPSANSPIPAYHRHDYFHARPTPPAASLPPDAAANSSTSSTSSTSSYWNPVSHPQASPPVSPTEQRPPSTSAAPAPTTQPLTAAARVYQEPTFRRQPVSKPDPALHQSVLSSGLHNNAHSTAQLRQDSAIDQHRFDTRNDAQLSKANLSYPHQSPKDSQHLPSPTHSSYQPASSAPAHPSVPAPHHGDSFASQSGPHPTPRPYSKSVSSDTSHSLGSPKSNEHSTERITTVDIKNGPSDSRPNISGPSSFPEQFFTQQNNFGTRQQRYNVRFAANYTSENMSPSNKPRTEPPTPPRAPATIAEVDEEPKSSPVHTSTTDDSVAPSTNGVSRQSEAHSRAIRDTRDRSEREPSVERCVGCNEAWRRPIPDMPNMAPAENNADYMRLASNMIDRLRDQRKKADAAYDDWKWRHSHCHRPVSPRSAGSLDEPVRQPDAATPLDASTNGNANNKRKSEVPHESQSALKQPRREDTSPPPPARKSNVS